MCGAASKEYDGIKKVGIFIDALMPLIRFLSVRIPNQGCLIEKEVVLLGNLGCDRLVSCDSQSVAKIHNNSCPRNVSKLLANE